MSAVESVVSSPNRETSTSSYPSWIWLSFLSLAACSGQFLSTLANGDIDNRNFLVPDLKDKT